MTRVRIAHRLLSVIVAAFVSGCAVGPDFMSPSPPKANGYTGAPLPSQTASAKDKAGVAQHFTVGRDLPGDWWRVFGNAPLGSLVARALKRNPDLKAAQAALRVADANTAAAQGAFLPQIDGGFSASRQRAGAGSTVGLATDTPTYNLFTGQVQVSYTPDVFGGTRRLTESLQAESEIERFQLEATYLTLTSHIVLASVQEASLRGRIAATRKLIKIAADLLQGMRAQLNAGAITEADIVTQEAILAQIEQDLPPLEQQLAVQRHLLTALTGSFPSEELPEAFELRDFHLPHDLPLSLPSRLVQQRPDVRAAEAKMQRTSALIGVAVANRLPNISLTASSGVNATSPDQILAPGSNVWSVLGSAMMPLFHGGTLFQHEVAAREAFDEASSQYRSAVITAFQNVADCLSALHTDAQALQKAVAFENAAAKTLQMVRERLNAGDVNNVELLNAQLSYQRALITLVLARSSRFADTAALFQALGGGWWNRTDVEPAKRRPFLSFGKDQTS